MEYDDLLAKYSRPGAMAQLAVEQAGVPRHNSVAEDKLSKIRICGTCQAMGHVTKQYGYRVLQERCTECDGEGLIGAKQPTDALSAEHARKQRITQLEAAIREAESLEALEQLEAELLALNAPANAEQTAQA
ncbi:hypothetical protein KFE25_012512 [Diacronema lutheri]|uniref:Uncharacterized protein n=2 Tax=Diacronema lutheri TaxID=2081491 RepID=A0A8J5XL85_DIALT|nr:hypothetical protein KFE25_012512 [Diacronema lutheri]